ncbi:MAG: 6-bladed beta-propeller, partial [Candidatus Aminicenantales bacterium]
MEKGVEVVDNGSETHPVAGQPRALSLKEEFRIDLENPALADTGLTDVSKIDVDSKGRIYIFRKFHQGQGPLVYKFDERGRFLKSFISLGQGPGEVEAPFYWPISANEEIRIYERKGQHVISYFDLDGRFLRRESKQGKQDSHISGMSIHPLSNGNVLARRPILDE